jgi:N-acetylmuramoyl-L-alanine amidase
LSNFVDISTLMRFSLFLVFIFLLGFSSPLEAQRLSRLGTVPDWARLEAFQETITREDFVRLLDRVYAPHGAWHPWIKVENDRALITTGEGQSPFILRFASSRTTAAAVPRFWRARSELPPPPARRPLQGLRIALDPGHIGGDWARIEERWFQIGDTRPVTEGDMVLYVARLLKPRLEQLGARVFLTRSKAAPVTSDRPERLLDAARQSLRERDVSFTERRLRLESEILFYRVSEIRARARLVNERFKPDLVLCLHFNAEGWGNPARPSLVEGNHLHFLIFGALSEEELGLEDQRFEMLLKLLNRSFHEELAVTSAVARSMAAGTGLPPFEYKSSVAVDVGGGPYIWGRNLLANRLFEPPVIFLEPYVMNNKEVWERIQAGDYAGLRTVAGKQRPSIYREYVDSLVEGLVEYYGRR